jgi:hypothetical protein
MKKLLGRRRFIIEALAGAVNRIPSDQERLSKLHKPGGLSALCDGLSR